MKGHDNMKKIIFRIITISALLGILSTSAMAEGPIEVFNDKGQITVKVSNLEPNEETTLLVVKGSATISQAFSDVSKIYHMDQLPSDSEGVSTFKFNYSGTDSMTIYSGYATMGINDDPYDIVLDESTPPSSSPELEFMYGDVNNDGIINVADASSIISHIISHIDFYDSSTGEIYEYGEQAADVNDDGVINVADASSIISYIISHIELPVNKVNEE